VTKPTHPVELLACAIATQEGFFANGTIPVTRNNPGDLYFAGQLGATLPVAGSKDPEIAVFVSSSRGVTALFRQLWLQVAMGQSVREVVAQWAPASGGNNSAEYLANVLAWTGLPADTPVLELLPALVPLNGAES
jgi:hypothetical protein